MDDLVIRAYLISVMVCPIFAFYHSRNKILIHGYKKSRALIRFTVISLLPLISYVSLFLLLIGIEEVFNQAIIPEIMGRTLILNLFAGILIALISFISFVIYTAIYDKNKNQSGINMY